MIFIFVFGLKLKKRTFVRIESLINYLIAFILCDFSFFKASSKSLVEKKT